MIVFVILKMLIAIKNIIHCKPDMKEVLGRITILYFVSFYMTVY